MKCTKCSLENRPEARFCKKCGQPLQAENAASESPMPSDTICPACGATAKPGARFCPRCGKPLPTEPTAPPPPAAAVTEPSMPIPEPATAAPSPPPAQPPAYAQSPSQPPPPTPPSTSGRGTPRWLWWVGGAVGFLCIAALVVAAAVLGPKIFGAEEVPTATPTPTPSPTAEATVPIVPPTEPPPPEPPTAIPPTELPPAEVPVPTSTPAGLPAPPFSAQVSISPSATELRVGESVTITATVINTGEVTFGNLRYQLIGEWAPYLRMTTSEVVEHESDLVPGQSDMATFVLEAVQAGTARLQANVTVKTRGAPPSVKPVPSEDIVEIAVIQ